MAITNEKSGELFKWTQLVGHGLKMEDVVFCEYGHKVHPRHTGHADYIVDWWNPKLGYTLALRVESKAANDIRFEFSNLKDHQKVWMNKWADATGNPYQCWVWLQLGNKDLDAILKDEHGKPILNSNRKSVPHPDRRIIYLVTLVRYLEVEMQMWERGGVKNLPMNAQAASTRINTRDLNLHAEALIGEYRLYHQGYGNWWMAPDHPIWSVLDTPYISYEAAVQRRDSRQHPE